jgi:hypothetical protein
LHLFAITHSFSFFLSLCSHRNKPAVFCNHTLYFFLQSLATQACNHIPNNQFRFSTTDKVRFSFFCNHTQLLFAISHAK